MAFAVLLTRIPSVAEPIWQLVSGAGPLVAVAIHAGHAVRDEVAANLALDEGGRLREEDPFTDAWTEIAPTRVVALRSRFEVDLNRPRERAVYRRPQDAWGLNIWKSKLPKRVIAESLAEYDAFYEAMRDVLKRVERDCSRFFVFDLHSYNHQRGGQDAPAAEESENPQVNIGTGTMNRARWAPVVDRFIAELRAYDFPGGQLDVRENVKFRGGHFARWVHETFPETGCALAVEFKKFFMDEWTGEADQYLVQAIGAALHSTTQGLLTQLRSL
ncbi:MAG: N-formylglutamate amidohydrolase [Planctomycetes bacterium]|nr:N-formylglutamate amidohydrolase [Planctomycetota bacterium]